MTTILFFLLPLTAFSGWFAAKRYYGDSDTPAKNKRFARDYLQGLNYLLNEQPDKAVDVFVKMLSIDSETVETHLALGTLFRRRGEVDRAIRIHQNLIARPQLPKQLRSEALLALARDYLRAGLLDRAERLFLEIINSTDSDFSDLATQHLLDIYQQEKRWDAAISVADKVGSNKNIKTRAAQYYCELAAYAINQNQLEAAQNYLNKALDNDSGCARASLLQGEIDTRLGKYKAAIQAYQKVRTQDADYLTEIISPLIFCHEKLNTEDDLIVYLKTCLAEQPRISIVLALANIAQRREGTTAAANYIAKQLHQRPSLRGLQKLIELQLTIASDGAKTDLLTLQAIVNNLLKNKSAYRCVQCGFSSRIIHWHCPGCKNWKTVKPILGLEGD